MTIIIPVGIINPVLQMRKLGHREMLANIKDGMQLSWSGFKVPFLNSMIISHQE